MKTTTEIPMESLDDLLNWHQAQANRHRRLHQKHGEDYGKYPKYAAMKQRGDQYKINFHQSAANVVRAALNERNESNPKYKYSRSFAMA